MITNIIIVLIYALFKLEGIYTFYDLFCCS